MKRYFANLKKELLGHYAGYYGKRAVLSLSAAAYIAAFSGLYFAQSSLPFQVFEQAKSYAAFALGYLIICAIIMPISLWSNLQKEAAQKHYFMAFECGHRGGHIAVAKLTASLLISLKTLIPAFIGYALVSKYVFGQNFTVLEVASASLICTNILAIFCSIILVASVLGASKFFASLCLVFLCFFVGLFCFLGRVNILNFASFETAAYLGGGTLGIVVCLVVFACIKLGFDLRICQASN